MAQSITNPGTRLAGLLAVQTGLTLHDRIMRGNYDWIESELIERKFPVTADQEGDWRWKLFPFDRNISFEKAIMLMKEDGYDAGQIGHILTFGEKYPEEQRKYPIVGPGSVTWLGLHRVVPVLWGDGGSRGLDLSWIGDDWGDGCRLFGVRRRSFA